MSCAYFYQKISYKKLTYMLTEADKPWDVQVESQKSWWMWFQSEGWQAGRLEPQEEPIFQLVSEAGKNWCSSSGQLGQVSSFLLKVGSAFFFIWVLSWLDETHPHWGGQSLLFRLPIQMWISSRNRVMFNQMSGHPWSSQVDTEN